MTLSLPLWGQNGQYPAALDRQLITAALGEARVFGDGLKVGPRGLGTNMSVDVSAGRVVMPGPNGSYLGDSDAIENVAIGAGPTAGTSRLDLVVAQVTDPEAMGEGDALAWNIVVVPGVAQANPIEPEVPAWSTPLGLVSVTTDTAAIAATAITDRRWRHGELLGRLNVSNRQTSSSTGGQVGTIPLFIGPGTRLVELSLWTRQGRGTNAGLVRTDMRFGETRILDVSTYHPATGGPGQTSSYMSALVNLSEGVQQASLWLTNPNNSGIAALVSSTWIVRDVGPADPLAQWTV